MIIKLFVLIICMASNCFKLVSDICPSLLIIRFKISLPFSIKSSPHVKSIQPHLIGINIFMEKTSFCIARLNTRIIIHQVIMQEISSFLITACIIRSILLVKFFFPLIQSKKNFSWIYIVYISFFKILKRTIRINGIIRIFFCPLIIVTSPVSILILLT